MLASRKAVEGVGSIAAQVQVERMVAPQLRTVGHGEQRDAKLLAVGVHPSLERLRQVVRALRRGECERATLTRLHRHGRGHTHFIQHGERRLVDKQARDANTLALTRREATPREGLVQIGVGGCQALEANPLQHLHEALRRRVQRRRLGPASRARMGETKS